MIGVSTKRERERGKKILCLFILYAKHKEKHLFPPPPRALALFSFRKRSSTLCAPHKDTHEEDIKTAMISKEKETNERNNNFFFRKGERKQRENWAVNTLVCFTNKRIFLFDFFISPFHVFLFNIASLKYFFFPFDSITWKSDRS